VLHDLTLVVQSLADRVSASACPWTLSLRTDELDTPVLMRPEDRNNRFPATSHPVEWVTARPAFVQLDPATGTVHDPRGYVLHPSREPTPPLCLYHTHVTLRLLEHFRLLLQTWPSLRRLDVSTPRVLLQRPPISQPRPGPAPVASANLPCSDWLSYAFHRRASRGFVHDFGADANAGVVADRKVHSTLASNDEFLDRLYELAREVFNVPAPETAQEKKSDAPAGPRHPLLGTGPAPRMHLRMRPLHPEQWTQELAAKTRALGATNASAAVSVHLSLVFSVIVV
jgi:hypothetical protein